jgi:hypothetical protein
MQDWHTDKTNDEILGMGSHVSNSTQHIFILTLKGASTLFYKSNSELLNYWYEQAEEFAFTYGGTELQAMISNKHQIVSAEVGLSSINKAGKNFGTIHASPNPGDGRLLILVAPDNRKTVRALQAFEDYYFTLSKR